jgi:mitotic-spindle organizing protein 1
MSSEGVQANNNSSGSKADGKETMECTLYTQIYAPYKYVNEMNLVLFEMSKILDCGLDMKSLEICVTMLENGVNPEALAAVMKELRRDGKRAN